jgi:hypothetical protein
LTRLRQGYGVAGELQGTAAVAHTTVGHSWGIFGHEIEISGFLANVLFSRKLNYVNNFVF